MGTYITFLLVKDLVCVFPQSGCVFLFHRVSLPISLITLPSNCLIVLTKVDMEAILVRHLETVTGNR